MTKNLRWPLYLTISLFDPNYKIPRILMNKIHKKEGHGTIYIIYSHSIWSYSENL